MEIIYLKGDKLNIHDPICSEVGFFDGLHLGHMALIHKVQDISKNKGYKTALMTFDHHPLYVLGKMDEEKYMTSMDDRISILEKENIDYLFIIEFSKEVAQLSPDDFIEKYLLNSHICHVVCGFDYRFGHKNSGNIQTLQDCLKLDVSVVDEVIYQEEKISSSRIRRLLEIGQVDDVHMLLGHNYCILGKVISGRHIGHSIGFPTANVDYSSYLLPKRGVYVVKFYVNDHCYMGMCNIGYNPTFTVLDKPSMEVYVLDFDQNIYDQYVTVEFCSLIRFESSFKTKEQLIKQLNLDEKYVREYFENKMLGS